MGSKGNWAQKNAKFSHKTWNSKHHLKWKDEWDFTEQFGEQVFCVWDGGWEEGEIPAGTIRGEAIIHEEDVGL